MKLKSVFFEILNSAINETPLDAEKFRGLSHAEWVGIYTIAKEQGVTAIAFEKIKELPKDATPPQEIVLKWYSHAMYIEKALRRMRATANEFAEHLHKRGIETVVMKGFAFADYYPNPFHRECGDLDCFLLGNAKEGNDVAREIGAHVEEDDYKHSHLQYNGLTIENHHFLTQFNNTKKGIDTERWLQSLIGKFPTRMGESKLLKPNTDFNAFFLLKHAQHHFLFEGIKVKHILDWAFLLKHEEKNLSKDVLLPALEKANLLNFAYVMTYLCEKYFQQTINCEWIKGYENDKNIRTIGEEVMKDTLGEQPSVFEKNIFKKGLRILRRFKRLWKFRLLSDESYLTHVWNTFAFSSYLKRKVNIS